MDSKTVRAAVFGAMFSATAIGIYAYLTPSDAGAVVSLPDQRPDTASNPAIQPWSDFLSKDAVQASGIELNLDGNASALISSDQINALP